jgi:hypothetical protein
MESIVWRFSYESTILLHHWVMLNENFFGSNSTFTMNGKLGVNVEQNIFKSVDIHNTLLYDEPVFWRALQDLRQ